MELKNKTAIVTGVSKGIGLAMALALLEKGAKVYGWSRTKPNIDDANFTHQVVDIRSDEAVRSAVKEIGDEVDILINNAGMGIFANFEDTTDEQWHQMFDTNVNGLFYTTRAVIPLMKAQKAGHVINIASIAALNGINQAAGYCATKHAVRGLSHSLYQEVKKMNIKVTCVYPGSVNTEFFNDIESIKANETMIQPQDLAASMVHLLESPDNYNVSDFEVRPMNPVYQ